MNKAFYNTVGLSQQELALHEPRAKSQNEDILKIFKERDGIWLTPFHAHSILKAKTGKDTPITSVRRAITSLTKAGELLKSVQATGRGAYQVRNHVWTLNKKSA